MKKTIFLLLLLCTFSVIAKTIDQPTRKEWSESLLDIEGRDVISSSNNLDEVKKAFAKPWEYGFKFTNFKTKKETEIQSCSALFSFLDKHRNPFSRDWYDYLYNFASCTAMDEIIKAKPARFNKLDQFRIDEDTLKHLTNELQPALSNDQGEILNANKNLSYWQISQKFKKMFGVGKVFKMDDLTTQIDDNSGGHQRLRILGFADVNGDGYQDVLLTSEIFVDGGTLHTVELFALTRTEGKKITIAKKYRIPGASE